MKPALKSPEFWISLVLGLATIILYLPVRHHQFLLLDDPDYVIANPFVNLGLTPEGAVWAFTDSHAANWHPLTWLSLMLDVQLWGVNPGPLLLENACIHALNGLLVFWFWRLATGAIWRSALVAALFAWHPLRVESVAWVSERKDVLSLFFGLLSLLSYLRYTQKPTRRWQALTFVFLTCGLLAKPTLVTLPFVFLLLDFWPLQRLRLDDPPDAFKRRFTGLLVEKIPCFALVLAASIVTFTVQHQAGSMADAQNIPFLARAGHASLAYVTYLRKTFWPADLAIFYPLPHQTLALPTLLALVFLIGVSVWIWRQAGARPWLLAGWFTFLGTLVPMIGLVQVGSQALADRYTYLPHFGLLAALVWGGAELARGHPRTSRFLAAFSLALVLACLVLSARQLRFWQNTKSVFSHCLEVTHDNFAAHLNLGFGAAVEGHIDEAVLHYSEALRIDPRLAGHPTTLATDLIAHEKPVDALTILDCVFKYQPGYPDAHRVAGDALVKLNRLDEAVTQYRQAVQSAPGNPENHHQLGRALAAQNHWPEAALCYEQALRLEPSLAGLSNELALARLMIDQRK